MLIIFWGDYLSFHLAVHTETLSCVFVLFTVLKGIENDQLITWNNTKTQENLSVCTELLLIILK